jgi:(4-O-methyl)-D-glucuronate---lignin esterase
MGIAPDFDHNKPNPDAQILFVHRRLKGGDIYFLDNRQNRDERIEARFRVAGKVPELWHADTGRMEAVSYRIVGAQTFVPLHFGPEESLFVLFRKPTKLKALSLHNPAYEPVVAIGDDWTVTFQPGRGAPHSIKLASLGSLSSQPDPAVRYFSGVATYSRSFRLPAQVRPGEPLVLDLGQVGDIAEVRVNGRLVGTAWHAPYQLDIGNATRAGRNRLQIKVADLWVNRLIGDAQPGTHKVTWTALPTYVPSAPLRPSGLIGPVRLLAPTQQE